MKSKRRIYWRIVLTSSYIQRYEEEIRAISKYHSNGVTLRAKDNKRHRLLMLSAATAIFLVLPLFGATRTSWLMTAIGLPTAYAQEEEVSEPSLTNEDDDGEAGAGEQELSSMSEAEAEVLEVEPQVSKIPASEPSVTTEEDDPEEAPVDSPEAPALLDGDELGD